jgi:hypothetical protein
MDDEKIIFTMEHAEYREGRVTNRYALFFTDRRIIVAETIDVREKLPGTHHHAGLPSASGRVVGSLAMGSSAAHTVSGAAGGEAPTFEEGRRLWDLAAERVNEMSGKTPDEILALNRNNFEMPYSSISSVSLRSGDVLEFTRLVISTGSKNYGFNVGMGKYKITGKPDPDVFNNYSDFLKSLFKERFNVQ